MSRFLQIYELFTFISVIFGLTWVWAFDQTPSIEPQLVPTVVNGLASSISLIVGFTGALITIAISNPLFKVTIYRFFFHDIGYTSFNVVVMECFCRLN